MARTKPSPLAAIRKQVASEAKLRSAALVGSGYRKLQIRNAKRSGTLPPPTNNVVESAFGTVVKKNANKAVKKNKKAQQKSTPREGELSSPRPEVEYWGLAGGDIVLQAISDEQKSPSRVLGIARIATWRKTSFVEHLKPLLSEKSTMEDIEVTAKDLDYGGEMRTDICVKFRSELVAEVAKDKIDGVLLQGRKLQVKYV